MLKSIVPLVKCLLICLCLIATGVVGVMEKSLFSDDFCQIKCRNNMTHTMCFKPDAKPQCKPYELYDFTKKYDDQMFLRTLVEGHNGIRNRIAEKMNVTNMIELTWDLKLEHMAKNYLLRCEEFQIDACTLSQDIILEDQTISHFYKSNLSSPHISQNSYYERGSFYPYKFLERMIRQWYFEKENMRPPLFKLTENTWVGRLAGENNFTHLAYPWSHRFGCAMAKFKGGYHVVCNYFPYFRTMTNNVYFTSGSTLSDCPSHFPLYDHKFSFLCTHDVEDFFDIAINSVQQSNFIIATCLVTLWLCNLKL